MLELLAPAKINLTLEVLGKRIDGFHEIKSIAQTVSLCDRLTFHPSFKTRFISDMPGWVPTESLLPKTVDLLRETTPCRKGVTIEINKLIPLFSGLGGDSSDAAATLSGLNRLWDLKLSRSDLIQLAAGLGSDVPLFIYGGTVLMEGRGEEVSPLQPFPYMWLVIMQPDVTAGRGKTGRAYSLVKPSHYSDGGITDRLTGLITGSEDMELIMNEFGITRERFLFLLGNVFDSIAPGCYEGLKDYWRKFLDAGARAPHVAGTGPAIYTPCETLEEAEKIQARLKTQGIKCYLAHTLGSTDIG